LSLRLVRLSSLPEVVKALQERGAAVIGIEMDVSKNDSVKEAFSRLAELGEKIDILVNNAALGKATPIFARDDEHYGNFEEVIHTSSLRAFLGFLAKKDTIGPYRQT
jgi:NAD(P)-dependent dehydrogenase (short-subunit alcohol dehydrogenase family)